MVPLQRAQSVMEQRAVSQTEGVYSLVTQALADSVAAPSKEGA